MTRSIEDGEIVDDRDNNVETCSASHRIFTCKTCNREFPSFQALGGHQSSHNRSEDANSLKKSNKRTLEPCSSSHRVFACKTCDRQFSSFQALGGHRASHTRPTSSDDAGSPKKMHKCSICGEEFQIGQALGGHMRKHWVAEKPILKKSNNNSKNLSFDLNLTAKENNL